MLSKKRGCEWKSCGLNISWFSSQAGRTRLRGSLRIITSAKILVRHLDQDLWYVCMSATSDCPQVEVICGYGPTTMEFNTHCPKTTIYLFLVWTHQICVVDIICYIILISYPLFLYIFYIYVLCDFCLFFLSWIYTIRVHWPMYITYHRLRM